MLVCRVKPTFYLFLSVWSRPGFSEREGIFYQENHTKLPRRGNQCLKAGCAVVEKRALQREETMYAEMEAEKSGDVLWGKAAGCNVASKMLWKYT